MVGSALHSWNYSDSKWNILLNILGEKIATHRKYISCTLCEIHPQRGVETSEVANLMKRLLKEGEV